MTRFLLTVVLFFLGINLFSQSSIIDSVNLILDSEYHDSLKIDKLNEYIYKYSSNFPEIILAYSDSAIELSEKMKDSTRLNYSITRKGAVQYYLGDYNSSLENYFLALTIKEKIGEMSSAWREYNNIGLILRNYNQSEEALKYFKITLEHVLKTGNKPAEAIVWNNIGISLRGLKQYEEAKEALEKAYKINSEIGANLPMAQDLNNLGNIYKDQKKFKQAIEYYEKALEINKSEDIRYEVAQNLNNLSEVYLVLNEFSKAKMYLKESEEVLSTIKADQLKLINLDFYGRFYTQVKNYKQAILYKNEYIALRDSLFFTNRIKQFNQLKTIANAEKEIQEIEFLKKINSIQKEKIRIQRVIQFGGGFLTLSLLVLLFIVIRDLKTKRNLNYSLREHILEEETLNEELKSTNEELNSQRDSLEEALVNLQSTQKQLIHSEKMASLGLLASGIAHEINNPLNFIKGGVFGLEVYFSENLEEHIPEVSPLLDGINEGIHRAADIVSSLNHYSRRDDLKMIECDIHAIIDNCLTIVQNQTKNRIEVEKRYTDKEHTIIGNEGKLHQAILNVLINAIQAIEGKGTIAVKTFITNKKFELIISDSGCGISPENLKKIHDPFYTTKDPGKGTGLGLSITYNLLQEHKGNIEVESELKKGTDVIITLPLKNSENNE